MFLNRFLWVSILLGVLLVLLVFINTVQAALDNMQALGKALFFDTNLSQNRTQSCATCHVPEKGLVDARDKGIAAMVSLGDDGKSLGDRNTPTAGYAAFSPPFYKNKKGDYVGGQFHDGRAHDLAEQAAEPPLNPIEMGMPSKQAVVERLRENQAYVSAFKRLFGDAILHDPEQAYAAMAESIAAFEKTDFFAPFDSKYDRYLRGGYQLTAQEDLGMTLFFSQQFTNCNMCHQLKQRPSAEGETFTNYKYHNIGTPINHAVRKINGTAKGHIDQGLLDNPQVNDPKQAGKFKVPTLRNVAVTAPYMHNGVFKDLRTVLLFYNKYNSRSAKRQINPETGEKWAVPEVSENLSLKELETGPALNNKRIAALEAFLKLLTDKRYEHLQD
jgi:cytochrome c peroxidase